MTLDGYWMLLFSKTWAASGRVTESGSYRRWPLMARARRKCAVWARSRPSGDDAFQCYDA